MKKVLILLLALSLTGCSSVTKTAASKGEVVDCVDVNHVAAKAGDTLLNCLTGAEKISVESLRGPLILNVWGSWCGPCKQEMPYFVDFHHQANGKVQLLGIAVEEAKAQVKIAEQKAAETSAKIEYKFIDKVKVVKDVQVIIQEKIVEKEKIIDSGCKVAPEALSILNEASKVPGGKK